jgi:FdhD protein
MQTYRSGVWREGDRLLAEETPIAFTYERTTYAVMLATPADLEDFAYGFSFTEGLIERAEDVSEIEIVPRRIGEENAIEVRVELAPARREAFWKRRRFLMGATGCGLCGTESLEAALTVLPPPPAEARDTAGNETGLVLSDEDVERGMAALGAAQTLNRASRALHAAAFWEPRKGEILVREDVGRHNALDKVAGAVLRRRANGREGAVLLTSRVSLELIQKTARLGAPVLIAVSAPTALAVRRADALGLTLIAVARADGFEVFTHEERVRRRETRHVA